MILTGARQTGKTSILLLLKKYLEEKQENTHFLNLENQDNLKTLNEHPFNIFELIPKTKTKITVFVDEIQYLDNPTNFLKLLYDDKRDKIKIIATGSSSFYLDRKFKDSLVGRKFLFEIYPLQFNEYLVFNGLEKLLQEKKPNQLSQKKILREWNKYILYGAYPKVALEHDTGIKEILLNEIVSSYVKKDVVDAGVKSYEKYFAMLKILAGQTGELLNSQEISNALNIAHKTVEEYLYIMRKSYHIAVVRPFYRSFKKELVKMPKVYFFDLGFRNLLLNNFVKIEDRIDKGNYFENIIFRELLNKKRDVAKIKFWRTQNKNEVDFVVDDIAVEAKYNKKSFKLSKYNKFRKKYPEILLEVRDYEDVLKKIQELNILYL